MKKKTLYTQLLTLYPALLDDQSPGMVQLMLRRIHLWEFNAFHLDRFSSGHSLSTLCVHLFHSLGKKLQFLELCQILFSLKPSKKG